MGHINLSFLIGYGISQGYHEALSTTSRLVLVAGSSLKKNFMGCSVPGLARTQHGQVWMIGMDAMDSQAHLSIQNELLSYDIAHVLTGRCTGQHQDCNLIQHAILVHADLIALVDCNYRTGMSNGSTLSDSMSRAVAIRTRPLESGLPQGLVSINKGSPGQLAQAPKLGWSEWRHE